ncbi:MAG: hypothetical protein HUU17_03190 [Chthonomonadales bacterium]|nr:hypothetical protein [Chthonomonadales bacterium]
MSLVASNGQTRDKDRPYPRIRGLVRQLGWMGALVPGASRKNLDSATADLPEPEIYGDERIWRMTTDSESSPASEPPRRCVAIVRLKGDRIVSIRVATP